MESNAIILFTKVPEAGECKTRLQPYLSGEECAFLQESFIKDIYEQLQKIKADIIVCYTPEKALEKLSFLKTKKFIPQRGEGLGERMHNAISDILALGYSKCVLVGSDIPFISAENIEKSFQILEENDIAISPTEDGGYYSIGMKEPCEEIFSVEYGIGTVFDNTCKKIENAGKTYGLGSSSFDIDDKKDLLKLAGTLALKNSSECPYTKKALEKIGFELSILGAGEYNENYTFTDRLSGEKLVLRIPMGSQMNIKNQAAYEFEALKLLEISDRTPKPLLLGKPCEFAPLGYIVESFLPGKALEYEHHLGISAEILGSIHNVEVPENCGLISPANPIREIFAECTSMAKVYFDYEKGDADSKKLLKEMLKIGESMIDKSKDFGDRIIINTELNSGNFLINGENGHNYLVDWEKPLLAYAFQDLGHFLAPTTTFWKTDTILNKNQIDSFLLVYSKHSAQYHDTERLWDSTLPYFTMNCLRGLSWCAMALVEYQSPERILKNQQTYEKIKAYTTPTFMEMIRNDYLGG